MRAIARAVNGSGLAFQFGMKMGGDAGPAILAPTSLGGDSHGLRDAGQVQVQSKCLDRPVGETEREAAVIEWRVVAVDYGDELGAPRDDSGIPDNNHVAAGTGQGSLNPSGAAFG